MRAASTRRSVWPRPPARSVLAPEPPRSARDTATGAGGSCVGVGVLVCTCGVWKPITVAEEAEGAIEAEEEEDLEMMLMLDAAVAESVAPLDAPLDAVEVLEEVIWEWGGGGREGRGG